LNRLLVRLALIFACALAPLPARADIWDDPAFAKLAQAIKRYNAKDLKSAEKLCRESLKKYPGNILAHYLLGEILLEKERYAEAANEFRHTTGAYPNFSEGYGKLGMALSAMKDYANAQAAFERALAIAPDNLEALKGIGFVLGEQGKVKAAVRYYAKALAKGGGKDINVLIALVNLYEKQGDLNSAIKHLKQAIALQKTRPRLKRLAILNFNNKTYKEARALIEELHKAGKGDADTFYALGMIRYASGDKDGCIDALQKAIKANGSYVEARFNLAVVYTEKKMVPKAISELEKVVQIDPDFVRAYKTLGQIHENYRYDIEEAKKWYKRAEEAEQRIAKKKAAAKKPAPPAPKPKGATPKKRSK